MDVPGHLISPQRAVWFDEPSEPLLSFSSLSSLKDTVSAGLQSAGNVVPGLAAGVGALGALGTAAWQGLAPAVANVA